MWVILEVVSLVRVLRGILRDYKLESLFTYLEYRLKFRDGVHVFRYLVSLIMFISERWLLYREIHKQHYF